jgi:acylphosphatase
MTEPEVFRLHAVVEGRVQGVGFRAFTQRNAVLLGLTGWVRNRWDGTVEVVAEGPRPDLERFLRAIQHGPHVGTSREVKCDWQVATAEFSSFSIKMTG